MSCHKLEKIGIRKAVLSHTQRMEKQTEQKEILTNANSSLKPATQPVAITSPAATHTKNLATTDKGVILSRKDAEEYRAYKRQKKVEEIMRAIARSEAMLSQGEDVQRVCERAVRLKQAAVKLPPTKLLYARTYLTGSNVKLDCIIGGDGETLSKMKAYEAKWAIKRGAKEITVMLTPSLLSECRYGEIRKELKRLKRIAKRAVLKVWVDKKYAYPTISRVARLSCEMGVQYFCVPYFEGCEKLRLDMMCGCKLEISEVENIADFKKMTGAGMGRIVTKHIHEVYSEWMQEAEKIRFPSVPTEAPALPAIPPTTPSALSSNTQQDADKPKEVVDNKSKAITAQTPPTSDLKFL